MAGIKEKATPDERKIKSFAEDGTVYLLLILGLTFLVQTLSYARNLGIGGNISGMSISFLIAGSVLLTLIYFVLSYFCWARANNIKLFLVSGSFSGICAIIFFSSQEGFTPFSSIGYLAIFNGFQLATGMLEILVVLFSIRAYRIRSLPSSK